MDNILIITERFCVHENKLENELQKHLTTCLPGINSYQAVPAEYKYTFNCRFSLFKVTIVIEFLKFYDLSDQTAYQSLPEVGFANNMRYTAFHLYAYFIGYTVYHVR